MLFRSFFVRQRLIHIIKPAVIILMLSLPVAGWYIAPYAALVVGHTCQAKSITIFQEAERDVVTKAHWWFNPGIPKGRGIYSAEIEFRYRNGIKQVWHTDRSFELDYKFGLTDMRVETLHVTVLRNTGSADENPELYIDPVVKPGFKSPAFIFQLPGSVFMVGLNESPRTLCLPAL